MSEPFDIGRLDDVIHGRMRLGIMAALSGVEALEFNTLKTRLGATDGNLSVHLRKLEEAGFVEVAKTIEGRKPVTRARMTPVGRRAFIDYLDVLSGLTRPV